MKFSKLLPKRQSSSVKRIIGAMCNEILSKYESDNIMFDLDKNMGLLYGFTNIVSDVCHIRIGTCVTKEFINQFHKSDVSFDLAQITVFSVAMRHEEQHFKQYRYMSCNFISSDIDMGRLMVEFDIAQYSNSDYYWRNYHRNPREIDAEYSGVMNTYSYLFSNNLYKSIAGKCVLNYVNCRATNSYDDYWIIKPNGRDFESIAEVDKAFQDSFEQSLQYEPIYDLTRMQNGFAQVVDCYNCMGTNYVWDDFIEQFAKAETRLDRVEMMAKVNCFLHPELKSDYSFLGDFTIKNAPETRGEILDRVRAYNDIGYYAVSNDLKCNRADFVRQRDYKRLVVAKNSQHDRLNDVRFKKLVSDAVEIETNATSEFDNEYD